MRCNVSTKPNTIEVGNAYDQGCAGTGWFIGHFVDSPKSLRRRNDIEVKWGIHVANERRAQANAYQQSTTLSLLVSGSFRIEFPETSDIVDLTRPGDYVIFGPNVLHDWVSLTDAVVITVRWPSIHGEVTPKSVS